MQTLLYCPHNTHTDNVLRLQGLLSNFRNQSLPVDPVVRIFDTLL